MTRDFAWASCWILPAMFLLVAAPHASAGLIVTVNASVTPAGPGLTEYEYDINSDQSNSLAFIQFQLVVAPAADPQLIAGPAGWDVFYDNLFGVISWTSYDPSTDIPPGGLGIFTFESPLSPGTQEYSAAGLDNDTGDYDIAYGETLSPTISAAVPEPSSIVLVTSGLIASGLAAWQRRRRIGKHRIAAS